MADAEHLFHVQCDWTGGREGQGTVRADAGAMPYGLPPQLGGSPGRTNPEEALLGAVGMCYDITFGILAERRRVPLESVRTDCEGLVVSQLGGTLKYASIRLKPRIVLRGADEAQRKAAEELAHKADQYCLISNAIRGSVELSVEPQIVDA